MVKNRIKRKTRRKTRGKTHTLRNKTKRKSRKRGGMPGANTTRRVNRKKIKKGRAAARRSAAAATAARDQAAVQNQTIRNQEHALNRSTTLPEDLQHNIFTFSHPTVATGLMPRDNVEWDGVHRRMDGMTKITQLARDRLHTQVALPETPKGTLITTDAIHDMMGEGDLDPAQDDEVRRLVARLYSNSEDGYRDEWIFGTGVFNSQAPVRVGSHDQRKVVRQALLNQGGPNDLRINNQNLPTPIKILRKNRNVQTNNITRTYPTKNDGTVEETNDVFWPINRLEFYNFMRRYPTLEEMRHFGW